MISYQIEAASRQPTFDCSQYWWINSKYYVAITGYSRLQYRSKIVRCSWHAPVRNARVGQCSNVDCCWITYSLEITLYRAVQEVYRAWGKATGL